MKLLLRLGKEAIRYRTLYIIAILSTFLLTLVNLAAPKVLSTMTSYVERGVDQSALNKIAGLTALLIALYLAKILFRYLSNYLAHKAAWNLVEETRIRVYRHIQSFSMSFFHDKQTGDLMSRVVNDKPSCCISRSFIHRSQDWHVCWRILSRPTQAQKGLCPSWICRLKYRMLPAPRT